MKKEITLFIISCGVLLTSCAQSMNKISKVYAYVKVTVPGRAMAGVDGKNENPAPRIDRFLYIEYKGTVRPDIDTVFYNNIGFFSMTLKPEDGEVGINKTTGEPVHLKVTKGNSLWKINLEQIDKTQSLPEQTQPVSIKIKSGLKAATYTKKEMELTVPDMY